MKVSPSVPSNRPSRRRDMITIEVTTAEHRARTARLLETLAGAELAHGHHDAAEHLTRRAESLRAVAQ